LKSDARFSAISIEQFTEARLSGNGEPPAGLTRSESRCCSRKLKAKTRQAISVGELRLGRARISARPKVSLAISLSVPLKIKHGWLPHWRNVWCLVFSALCLFSVFFSLNGVTIRAKQLKLNRIWMF